VTAVWIQQPHRFFCGNAERGLKQAMQKRVQYSSPNEIRRPMVLLSVT